MQAIIECIVDAPEKEKVEQVLDALSSITKKIESVSTTVVDIEKTSGLFEETYTGALLLNVATPILTGIAANAIWSWILSKKSKITSESAENPNNPIKIKIDNINIVVSVKTKDE